MYGDSFFTMKRHGGRKSASAGFRPHVWGFFFHKSKMMNYNVNHMFSSPCMGILFSRGEISHLTADKPVKFSSPCMGILFSLQLTPVQLLTCTVTFSSPCMGILFSRFVGNVERSIKLGVFVPMYGDSFFTVKYIFSRLLTCLVVFVPMYGDSFFTIYFHQNIRETL